VDSTLENVDNAIDKHWSKTEPVKWKVQRLSDSLRFIVSSLGCLVLCCWLFGWFTRPFDIAFIPDGWATMKWATALCFVGAYPAGLNGRSKQIVVGVIATVFVFVLTRVGYPVLEKSTGVVYGLAGNVPSALTFAGVILLLFRREWAAWSVLMIAIIATLGYLLKQPLMFFYVPDRSTAMAFPTAFLFMLWSVAEIREHLVKG